MKKKKLLAWALAMAMTVSVVPVSVSAEENTESASVMAELYVSPSGSADGAGTESDPLNSLESARKKVQTMNQNMTGDIVVYLEDGEYLVKDTVAFTTEDSGSNGYDVIYKAKDGAEPVLTGGVHVTDWSDANDSERPGLMVADLDIDNTRQVYVNGEMATRAKGSISGNMYRDGDKTVYTTYNGDHDAYTGFTVENTEVQNWRNPGDIEFVWDISWAHRIAKVESIEAKDDTHSFIKMYWPTFKTGQIAGGVQITGAPNYVENAYELLDEAGEWYFDRVEKKLYYMPEDGQDMNTANVIVPAVEEIITVTGDRSQKAGNLRFEGLNFEYNTWLTPSEMGWPEQQANFAHDPAEDYNMHAYSLSPGAAIETKYAQNVTFDGCTFQNLGSAAINILEGSVGNTVSNSVFKDISAGGIMVGGASITDAHPLQPGDTIENHIANGTAHDEAQIVKDNTITNNYFNGIGTEYKGSIAVVAGYTHHTVITHNTIRNVAYSGISVGWGWGFWDQDGRYINDQPDNETPADYPRFPKGDAAESSSNVIEYNNISQCMMKLHDGAGIYTLGDMPNSSIKYNLIYDNVGWPGGIYLDEGSGGMTVEGNITYNTQVALNHNVRSYTWGYREDHPVYSDDTNYWNVSPTMSNYPAELAAQTGVQDVSIIPKELNTMTAPEFLSSGDKIVLEGNFGEESGKVVLSGQDGPVVVDALSGNLVSWTQNKIVFCVPGGVVTGSLYVECADGTKTTTQKYNVGDYTNALFVDDFEDYEEGQLSEQSTAQERYQDIASEPVVTTDEEGNQYLYIARGSNTDVRINKPMDWENVMVTLDLRYDTNMHDFGGLFLSPRYIDNNNRYLVLMTPNYSNGMGYQQYVSGNCQGINGTGSYNYKTGVWYSVKAAVYGKDVKVKVWEKGTEEPNIWTSAASFTNFDKGGIQIQLTFLRDGEAASIDNVGVYEYTPGVTSDLSDDVTNPITTATVSGNLIAENTYGGTVKIALAAQDDNSGIADLEYKLGNGEYLSYENTLEFAADGDYTVTYRAIDRSGNIEDEKTLSFTVDSKAGITYEDAVLEDDFEDYEIGTMDLELKGYTNAGPADKLEIITDDTGNQLLKITGAGTDVRLLKNANWEYTEMTFDYKYEGATGFIEGLYASSYWQSLSPDNVYNYVFLKNYNSYDVSLQRNVGGNANSDVGISRDNLTLEADTWYHVKTQTSSTHMAIKVWADGENEPENWMAERDVTGLTGGGGLHLNFLGWNDSSKGYIDNLVVKEAKLTAETTKVSIDVQPENAAITVENTAGEAVAPEADGTYLLSGGTYTYTAEAEGYTKVSGTFSIDGEFTKTIAFAMNKVPADRSELDAIILEASEITEDELAKYTDDSVAAYRDALQTALGLSKKATQEEVDMVVANLRSAIDGLTLKDIEIQNPFTDVSEDSRFYDAIMWAYENGITNGKTETTFEPMADCTRGQVVTFLWRAEGCPEPTITKNPFTDVSSTSPFYKAILWAYENGITTGKTATTFQPDTTVTREQFVTFLWRCEDEPASTVTNPFVDVVEDRYSTPAILWAYENGITTGKTATTFQPGASVIRQHVVTFLYRAYN